MRQRGSLVSPRTVCTAIPTINSILLAGERAQSEHGPVLVGCTVCTLSTRVPPALLWTVFGGACCLGSNYSPFYHPRMCLFASLLRVGACVVQTFAPQNDPSNEAAGVGMVGEEKDDPGMAQSPTVTANAAAASIPSIALV